MRRHLLLHVLIVAIVVAFALLRSRWHAPAQVFKPSLPAAIPAETSDSEDAINSSSDTPDIATAPVADKSPAKDDGTPKPIEKKVPKTKTCRVLVLGIDGQPVEDAVVIIVSSKDYQETFQSSELRSDKEGMVEFDVLQDREWVLVYSYKTGAGHSYRTFYARWLDENPLTLKYVRDSPIRIRCVALDGAPLENIEIAIRAEIETSSSYDIYGNYLGSKYVPLPTRHARTKEDGRYEFDGLPDMGWISDGANRIPGCRFTITATWQAHATDKKINGFPKNEIQFVLE